MSSLPLYSKSKNNNVDSKSTNDSTTVPASNTSESEPIIEIRPDTLLKAKERISILKCDNCHELIYWDKGDKYQCPVCFETVLIKAKYKGSPTLFV